MAVHDLRLFADRTLCAVGPSHSGKSTFVQELLDRRHEVFRTVPKRVVWCYGVYQHAFHSALQAKGYVLHQGILPQEEVQPHDVVVLDDLLHESSTSRDVSAMFTRVAHHKPAFIIFITQNLFPPGKEARLRGLNTHYLAIFKNPRDKSQVEFLARQILPRQSKALRDIFEAATAKPHSYLFLDLTQECPDDLRFRSDVFSAEPTIFKPL